MNLTLPNVQESLVNHLRWRKVSPSLRKYATVFQAEMLVILERVQLCLIKGYANDHIVMRINSQATIKYTQIQFMGSVGMHQTLKLLTLNQVELSLDTQEMRSLYGSVHQLNHKVLRHGSIFSSCNKRKVRL